MWLRNPNSIAQTMFTKLFISLYYRLNKHVRDLSSLLIGNFYEAHRDVVLITGGSSGLGKEIAIRFAGAAANAGAVGRTTRNGSNSAFSGTSSPVIGRVIVVDIKIPTEENRIEGVLYFQCDVGDRRQVLHLQRQISEQVGHVTILINNAGIVSGKSVLELDYEELEKIIQVNLVASFYTIKAFLPQMLQQKRGYIITIASVLGYMSPARLSAYGASKSGLIALHESLTYELGPPSFNRSGVKTLLVCPGQLKSGMFRSVSSPCRTLAPELDPKYVASQILSTVKLGRRGEIRLPFYANFIPIFRAAPWPVVEVVRRLSGIDRSVRTFKSTVSLVNSRISSVVNSTATSLNSAVGSLRSAVVSISSAVVSVKSAVVSVGSKISREPSGSNTPVLITT